MDRCCQTSRCSDGAGFMAAGGRRSIWPRYEARLRIGRPWPSSCRSNATATARSALSRPCMASARDQAPLSNRDKCCWRMRSNISKAPLCAVNSICEPRSFLAAALARASPDAGWRRFNGLLAVLPPEASGLWPPKVPPAFPECNLPVRLGAVGACEDSAERAAPLGAERAVLLCAASAALLSSVLVFFLSSEGCRIFSGVGLAKV